MEKGRLRMNTMLAYAINMSTPDGHGKVFDWVKAAKILKEKNPDEACAGLLEDMEWTAGTIWLEHKPYNEEYTYLSSRWATPVLEIDGEHIECWESSDGSKWNSDTKWPDEALALI